MKIVKQVKCGSLWNGKGYIQIGLEKYDVKIVENPQKNNNSPKYRLVRVLGLKEQFLCTLFENSTKENKNYLNGTIELGFGEMEVKIFRIDENKRKDKEKSPTSIIFGRLLMSETEKNDTTTNTQNVPDNVPDIDIDEENIPF
jgi:hypothetical protein